MSFFGRRKFGPGKRKASVLPARQMFILSSGSEGRGKQLGNATVSDLPCRRVYFAPRKLTTVQTVFFSGRRKIGISFSGRRKIGISFSGRGKIGQAQLKTINNWTFRKRGDVSEGGREKEGAFR